MRSRRSRRCRPSARSTSSRGRRSTTWREDGGPRSLERDDVRTTRARRNVGAELAQQLFDDPAAMQARVVECSPSTGRSRSRRNGNGWSRFWPRRSSRPRPRPDRAPGRGAPELKVHPERAAARPPLDPPPHRRGRARQPAAADPERLRLAARARQLRRAVSACRPLPAGDDAQRARGTRPPTRSSPRSGHRRPDAAADPPARRERPRSTEELAPLVGLSESGLSKQPPRA